MNPKNILELVCANLPRDVMVDELKAVTVDRWWREKPSLAIAHALCKSQRINWDAYLANNPDVKEANIDPILHYLKHGIFEGRKLYSYNKLACARKGTPADVQGPKISIIMPNYNNGMYMEHSVQSALQQTLSDIELIIVDDCSTDNSQDIIKRLAKQNSRVKYELFPKKLGTHLSRKRGVELASGQYIMFMDSDDAYEPETCEIAYKEIRKGYDIVQFRARNIYRPICSNSYKRNNDEYHSNDVECEFHGAEILIALFHKHIITVTLWNKIYRSTLCKMAFASTNSKYLAGPEDNYESFALICQARSVKLIKDRLYIYYRGYGISTDNMPPRVLIGYGDTCQSIAEYRLKHYFNEEAESRIKFLFSVEFNDFIKGNNKDIAGKFFDAIIQQYDQLFIITEIKNLYFDQWYKLAQSVYHIQRDYNISGKCHIAIHIDDPGKSGLASEAANVLETLKTLGKSVSLLTSARPETDDEIYANISWNLIQGWEPYNRENIQKHLKDMYEEIRAKNIEMVIFTGADNPALMWDIMLCHLLHIPAIVLMASEAMYMFTRGGHYSSRHKLAVLRCADKVITNTELGEQYLRANGVDAQYLPVGVSNEYFDGEINYEASDIACIIDGMQENQARIADALKILLGILEELPGIKLNFILDCPTRKQYESLKDNIGRIAREYQLAANVQFTWGQQRGQLISTLGSCAALLLVSYTSASRQVIMSAQASGVPLVGYDLPLEGSYDNEAGLTVPQGDIRGTARVLVKLLEDKALRNRLQLTARDKARGFSTAKYVRNLGHLLENFTKCSSVTCSRPLQYQEMLQWQAFYR